MTESSTQGLEWNCEIPCFDLVSPNKLFRMHFGQRSRLKRSIETMLVGYGDPIFLLKGPVDLTIIRRYGYRKREFDEDNLYGACKPLIDAMKVRKKNKDGGLGIIKDDSPKHLNLMVTQEKSSEKESSIVIRAKSSTAID
jgi:hypothetical protein